MNRFENQPSIQEGDEGETELFPKNQWIEVSSGMQISYPNGTGVEELKMTIYENGVYGINNGVLAVVDEKGKMFVAPLTDDNFKTVERSGYKHGSISNIPFSDGKVPFYFRTEWKTMMQDAKYQEEHGGK